MAILVCPPREENIKEAGGLWEMEACVRTRGVGKGEACVCLRDAMVQSSTVRLVRTAPLNRHTHSPDHNQHTYAYASTHRHAYTFTNPCVRTYSQAHQHAVTQHLRICFHNISTCTQTLTLTCALSHHNTIHVFSGPNPNLLAPCVSEHALLSLLISSPSIHPFPSVFTCYLSFSKGSFDEVRL